MNNFKTQRQFLKTDLTVLSDIMTDLQKKLPQPPMVKPFDTTSEIIDLPTPSEDMVINNNLYSCINKRRSVRKYADTPLTLAELSFLLWATQGIEEVKPSFTLRTVPCSGATHSFETYLFINKVEELKRGAYRYLPLEHKLLFIKSNEHMAETIDQATPNQPFVPHFTKDTAVLFAWSTTPYRAEWKFAMTAHKKILIDVGHICQNLYIAGEALHCGTCAIGIYEQNLVDNLLNLDGENEFVVYMASVGKKL